MKWKRRALKGGGQIRRLKPDPRMRRITYDVFERGCAALGLDGDAILSGRADLAAIADPPVSRAEAFLSVVLANASAYNLRSMTPDVRTALVGQVAANFIFASVGASSLQRLTGRISDSDGLSTIRDLLTETFSSAAS